MARGTDQALDALHGILAEALTEEITRSLGRASEPLQIKDDEGKLIRNPAYAALSPQLLAQAIKFLKDNGIDAPTSSPRISNLERALAELDPDEETLREALRN